MNKQAAKTLAISLALNGVRNTFLEDLHAGIAPSSKSGDYTDVSVVTPFGEIPWSEVSRISDDEMRQLMKEVVNKLYTMLVRLDDDAFVERMTNYARLMTRHWDEPQELKDWFNGNSDM